MRHKFDKEKWKEQRGKRKKIKQVPDWAEKISEETGKGKPPWAGKGKGSNKGKGN